MQVPQVVVAAVALVLVVAEVKVLVAAVALVLGVAEVKVLVAAVAPVLVVAPEVHHDTMSSHTTLLQSKNPSARNDHTMCFYPPYGSNNNKILCDVENSGYALVALVLVAAMALVLLVRLCAQTK